MSGLLRSGLLILIAFSIFSWIYPQLQGSAELRDSDEYRFLAKNLSEKTLHYAGDPNEEIDMRLYTKRPMGYPILYSIGAVHNNSVLKAIQFCFVLILLIVGIQTLRLLRLSSVIAVFTVLFALSITILFSSQWLMADLALAVVVSIAMYYWISYRRNQSKSDLTRFFVLLSLSVLIKPIMLPACVLFSVIYIYLFARKRRLRIGPLLPILAVLFIFSMNHKITGLWHMSSISTINTSHYNAKLLIAAQYGLDSAEEYTEDEIFTTPTNREQYLAYSKSLNQRAEQTIMSHLPRYLLIHSAGMLKALIDPGRFEVYTFLHLNQESESLTELAWSGQYTKLFSALKKSPLTMVLLLVLSLISMLKFLSLFFLTKRDLLDQWMLIFCVLYFIGIAGPIGAFRFMMPAIIPYLLLSSIGLHRLLLKFQKGSKS